jgi:hypothetical protein
MAASTLTSGTVLGTAVVAFSALTVLTAGTITIAVDDMSRTFVRIENISTTASTIVSLGAGADPHVAAGIGALSVTLATAKTYYVGASWDSARFKTTAGTIVFNIATAGTVLVETMKMTVY